MKNDVEVLGADEGRTISLPSAIVVIKSAEASLANGKIVGELTAEPGFAGPGEHRHFDQAEMFYVLDGEFTFVVDSQGISLRPGMSIMIPPNTPHNFSNQTSTRARLLVIGDAKEFELYSVSS